MGLQNQLNDVSSDSIPLLLLALVAKSIDHLRCLFLSLFRSIGVSRLLSPQSVIVDDDLLTSMGSGLGNIVVLAEQLNINRIFSYRYSNSSHNDDDGGGDSRGGLDCVVCLCTLKDGDQARKLDCTHVFHKECFDGWLDHLNFNCPLCRTPLVSDERVISTRSGLGGDLLHWFSVR